MLGERDVVGAELGACHLERDGAHALTHLGGGAVEVRSTVVAEHDASRAVVVESLGEADVLEARGEADAAAHTLAVRRVPRPAR